MGNPVAESTILPFIVFVFDKETDEHVVTINPITAIKILRIKSHAFFFPQQISKKNLIAK
jgi:hypothetical protein